MFRPRPEFGVSLADRESDRVGVRDIAPLAEIFAKQRVETLAPDAIILAAGEPAFHVHQIVSGCLRVSRLTLGGRRSVLRFRFGPDYFGELFEGVYQNTAEAVTEVQLRRVPSSELRAAAAHDPALNLALHRWFAQSLSVIQSHLLVLAAHNALEKLARFLLLLSREPMCTNGSAHELVLPMNRLDVADFLGLTIESVSRAFTRLKLDGYIAIRGTQEIKINRLDALARLAKMDDPAVP